MHEKIINLGNVLSANAQEDWALEVFEEYFIDFKDIAFLNVRIPVDFYGIPTPTSGPKDFSTKTIQDRCKKRT